LSYLLVVVNKAVITSSDPTQLNSTQRNSTKSRQFAVSCEVLNMLRTSQLTKN